MNKPPKCTKGPRHAWEWKKDTTTRQMTIGALGSSAVISRRGVYACACGARKYGTARSGL